MRHYEYRLVIKNKFPCEYIPDIQEHFGEMYCNSLHIFKNSIKTKYNLKGTKINQEQCFEIDRDNRFRDVFGFDSKYFIWVVFYTATVDEVKNYEKQD